jgi:hypothetical protein
MGRTISSFRIVLAMEKVEWKPSRIALDKLDRKKFGEMFDISTSTFQDVQIVSSISGFISL